MSMGWNGLGFAGRRVLVTGAASGMGEATARILGELGAEVHALDVRRPAVPHAAFYEVDLRDPTAIDGAVAVLASGWRRQVVQLRWDFRSCRSARWAA